MFRTLEVTTAASVTALTTLAQLKADGGYDGSQDTLLTRAIELCSNDIAHYLRDATDEDEDVTLGRETVKETFYNLPVGGAPRLQLSRRPVGAVVSVKEGTTTTTRLLSGADGAISAADNTLTSALGPGGDSTGFTSAYVGNTITVTGAGASGADLTTTVASVTSETEIELTDAAGTTVSGAAFTVEQPAFTDVYITRKQRGEIIKRSGSVTIPFLIEPITVIYSAGWLMPGETGRNLPLVLETACIQYVRKKVDQIQEGQDFGGPLTAMSIDEVGSFQFGGANAATRGSGIPYEVRAIIDKFKEPVFA